MTVEEGASTALYLALEAPERLSGKFLWSDGTIVDWYAPLSSEVYAPYLHYFNEPLPVELQLMKSEINKENHHVSNVTNEVTIKEEVKEILFEEKSSDNKVTAGSENIEECIQEINGDEQLSALNQDGDESSILSEEQSSTTELVKTNISTENMISPETVLPPHQELANEFIQIDESNQPSIEQSPDENHLSTKIEDRPVVNSLLDDDLINIKTN